MTTVTRSNSRVAPPMYKDYVNFLASYKNGKKEETFSPNYGTPTSPNFQKSTPVFNEPSPVAKNANKEKSEPPKVGTTTTAQNLKSSVSNTNYKEQKVDSTEKTVKKSEIFIEIQPTRSVSEVSKMFEKQNPAKKAAPSSTISSKIGIFEKQTSVEKKPKISAKPPIQMVPKSPSEVPKAVPTKTELEDKLPPPPPPPAFTDCTDSVLPPPPPPLPSSTTQNVSVPSTPKSNQLQNGQSGKIQATLNGTTKFSMSTTEEMPSEIDRNNPLVKKLVYGALREFYGSYHQKATTMVSNLPENMVVRSNGVQDRIEQIAANGGLEKLNGRVNPKLSEEP